MLDTKKGTLHYKGFQQRVQRKQKGLLDFRCRNSALEKVLFILKYAGKEREGERNTQEGLNPDYHSI